MLTEVYKTASYTASLSSLVILLYYSAVTFQKASYKYLYLVYLNFQFVVEFVHARVVINVVYENSFHSFIKTMDL